MEKKTVATKQLTFKDLLFTGIGLTIGAGVVSTVGPAIGATGRSAWLAYMVSIIVGAFTTFPAAIFSSTFRVKGGVYTCLRNTLGDNVAGIYICMNILMGFNFATFAIASGAYISGLIPGVDARLVAVLVLVAFYLLNIRGLNVFVKVQTYMSYLLLAALIIFGVYGLFNLDSAVFNLSAPDFMMNGGSGFLQAVTMFMFSTVAYSVLLNFSGNAENPKRDIPRAMLGTIITIARDVLHADETTLQVLHEPGKKPESESYMWLYRTGGDTDKPIVLYEYQPGRGAKHPKEFLTGYKGYLHTDGYAGYHDLGEDITVVGCWAHARRKFDEAVKSLPKGKAKGSSASQGLTYCNLLFEIEQELAEFTAEERYEQRLKQAKPVLDAMFAWANTRTAAPKSALGKAFHYLKEQWPYLTNYLNDGRLEISNNRAERSIKPFVIDRKNFLFANTPKGAAGSAVMFSLIQTAIENNLDPYKYLTWLLKRAKDADLSDEQTIRTLLPWNAPLECRAGRKESKA